MRTLIVLRHAKAQPDAPRGDFARDLTDRGRRNAATVGRALAARLPRLDAIVSSDANRARQTAEIVAAQFDHTAPITLEHAIYGADVGDLLVVVRALPPAATAAMVVGHNPGFEDLAAALACADPLAVRLPTAGFAYLELDIDDWGRTALGSARLLAVESPKSLDPNVTE